MLELDLQDIKDAAGLDSAEFDDLVERIAARWQPLLESRLDPGLLADESAADPLAFALTEIIAAEVLNSLSRRAFLQAPEVWAASDRFMADDPFGLDRRGREILSSVTRTQARGVAVGTTELPPSRSW